MLSSEYVVSVAYSDNVRVLTYVSHSHNEYFELAVLSCLRTCKDKEEDRRRKGNVSLFSVPWPKHCVKENYIVFELVISLYVALLLRCKNDKHDK